MRIEFHLLNCFLSMPPLLIWNIVLGPKITDPRITSDAHSPAWLLISENITHIVVFALPLLFAPGSAWSNSALACSPRA